MSFALSRGGRTTVECGMRKGTPDLPFVLDLCQREEAMLVTADNPAGRYDLIAALRFSSMMNGCFFLRINGIREYYPNPRIEFPRHIKKYQRSHNDCCWGLMLLPADETKQIEILQRLKQGKIKLTHPHIPDFHFDYARHDNLFINLRADPPTVSDLCDCEWDED
jgi:hypothetical protein